MIDTASTKVLAGTAHILLLLVTLVFITFPAAAKDAWDVMAVRDQTGRLAFCRAELKDNDSPLTLAVALSPANEVNIGVRVPDAGFTPREGYDVTIAIDKIWSQKIQAETALADLLLIRLGTNAEFLPALVKGKNFTVSGAADSTNFALIGSKVMVDQLKQCIKQDKTAIAADDLAPATLPPGLMALLQEAKLTPQPVALPEDSNRIVDYAWIAKVDGKPVAGGFVEKPAAADATLADLVKAQAIAYEKQCRGTAKTQIDKAEAKPGISLQTVLITCTADKKIEIGAFLFYLTDTRIFATLIHRADSMGTAIKARDAVANVVRRVADEDSKAQ